MNAGEKILSGKENECTGHKRMTGIEREGFMMTCFIPKKYKFSAVHAGIKQDKTREDLALIVSEVPATAAGVYTRNIVCAAPVVVDRQRTPASEIRAVVINSGNANACTGERGIQDARNMAKFAAEQIGAEETSTLVMSTGIIGHFLPMENVQAGILKALSILSPTQEGMESVARGMMTTDTVMKLFTAEVMVEGVPVRIAVMGKGAGMIAPNMGTFLGVIATDAFLSAGSAQKLLQKVADQTINCVTVDGHVSTNDTFLMLANGAAFSEEKGSEFAEIPDAADSPEFCAELLRLCTQLAREMANDGEGASHMITIHVRGLKSDADAKKIARAVADSPLVKCACTGNDPNWGRIVSAAGYAGIPFDAQKVSLRVNDFLLFEKGSPAKFDAPAVSASMKENREICVELFFEEGSGNACVWTSDLTVDYVHINADYHT